MVFVYFNNCIAYDGDELDSTGCPNGKEKLYHILSEIKHEIYFILIMFGPTS